MEFHILVSLVIVSLFMATVQAQMKPILLDCGSNSSITVDGRQWIGDSVSGGNFTPSSLGITASTTMIDGEPLYGSLYRTARIFNTSSSYNFSVSSGNYYIRFHFCPFTFDDMNINDSSFDIMVNNLKLVSKFNVPGEMYWSNSNATSLVKEYFVSTNSNEIKVEFVPALGSFAFINAIEVIPVLHQLFNETLNKVGSSGLKSSLSLADPGFETMYRLNVGGPEIKSSEDKDLWRKWNSDAKYMFSINTATPYSSKSSISYASPNDSIVAPLVVYETARIMTESGVAEKRFNMSWKFDVDPNFDYIVRLHFCELVFDKPNQRVFRIYINNKTAAESFDVFRRAGGKNKAYHEDYFDTVSQQIDTLWLQLAPEPSASSSGSDAILNGIEIFKLSKNGNLAHPPERIKPNPGGPINEKQKNKYLWAAIGAGAGSAVTVSILCAVLICLHVRGKGSTAAKESPSVWRQLSLQGTIGSTINDKLSKSPSNGNISVAANRTGRRFTLSEIKTATRNFDESLVIGTGGFGKVYKGELDDGITVAIKRANPNSEQGLKEFETEIEMLSKLRHRHLVSMIGYCDEKNEMILVYEYMANGTLRSHLFGSDLPPLTWKQRLEACIGAARGLHYLHTGAERGIIHRDVKTTNILLDENFVAKMADFGLSKDGPALEHTHVSTAVKGSFGYLDPEYFRRQQLTEKSDVYSFGVVLFEVLCARPVINPTLPRDQINLAEWALHWQQKKSLETVIDHHLQADYSSESLKKFGEIAEKCLADEGKNRPTMGEVLWHLEYVLQLHDAHKRSAGADSRFTDVSISLPSIKEGEEEAFAEPDSTSASIVSA